MKKINKKGGKKLNKKNSISVFHNNNKNKKNIDNINAPPYKKKNITKKYKKFSNSNNIQNSENGNFSNVKLNDKNKLFSNNRKVTSNKDNLIDNKSKNKKNKNKKKIKKNNQNSSSYSLKNNYQKVKSLKSVKSFNHLKANQLTDQELNTLEYELALEIDKRSYFQYYWSLLKKKQLILFTFLPADDYNLLSIKISLFLVSFCLSLTINGFFFTDETMHNVYENNGVFDFIYQIQQILYSTIICAVINVILKKLSLSERNILEIKQQQNYQNVTDKSKNIEKCIKIKFGIFFILTVLLLVFFWYYISCFCIVYKNTQLILIKDTLISFGLSMIYPFGLNLLPGMLRIPALRDINKNKKCLYKFSLIISLI